MVKIMIEDHQNLSSLFILFSFTSIFITGCVTEQVTTEPITMTIADFTSGELLSDVIAVYRLEATEGTLTGHGGRHAQLAIVEALTGKDGVLHIPAQTIKPTPFLWRTNYRNPMIYLFKSGYEPTFIGNQWHTIPRLSDVLRWEKNGIRIKLRKPESFEKYVQRVDFFGNELRHLYEWPNIDSCGWKKIPRAILALEQENMAFEVSGRRRHNSTPLRGLLGDEAVRGNKSDDVRQCGSPSKFFSAYPVLCPSGKEMMTRIKRRPHIDEVSNAGTSIILYTIGYCPSDQKYWLYQEGKGWSVRSDLSLDFIKDKRYRERCRAVRKNYGYGESFEPDEAACATFCRKYCGDYQCGCFYGGLQVE